MSESASKRAACWYCGKQSDKLASVAWPMYRMIPNEPPDGREPVRWERANISAQRCPDCTRKRRWLTAIGVLLSAVVPGYVAVRAVTVALADHGGTLTSVQWVQALLFPLLVAVALSGLVMAILAWPGRLVARLMGTRLVPVSEALRELQHDGWRHGTKPPHVTARHYSDPRTP